MIARALLERAHADAVAVLRLCAVITPAVPTSMEVARIVRGNVGLSDVPLNEVREACKACGLQLADY